MGVTHHLGLGKLVFSGSADQRQHDAYTLPRGTGFLLRTPAQVSTFLALRQEFAVGLLAYLQGAKQIDIPNVVGQPYASARSTLLGAGLNVAESLVDSNQPVNTVIAQSPDPGTRVGAGTTVTLSVSRGSTATTPVPDVSNQDEPTAKAILTGSGFKVKVVKQSVTDPGEQGIVLNQQPAGGTNAPAGSTVTIFVGNYTGTTTAVP